MPLFDHFRPASQPVGWESIHSGWITRLADSFNEQLPEGFVALESIRWGLAFEVDIGINDDPTREHHEGNGTATAVLAPKTFTPAPPRRTHTPVFSDTFEVRIYGNRRPDRILAAVELVSPSNKDRPGEQAAFAAKCAALLSEGTSVLIVDVVGVPRFNLHRELTNLLDVSSVDDPTEVEPTYAASYSAVRRVEQAELDIWSESLTFGQAMPSLPLRIVGDYFIEVDLERTYMETRRRRRLT